MFVLFFFGKQTTIIDSFLVLPFHKVYLQGCICAYSFHLYLSILDFIHFYFYCRDPVAVPLLL